MTRIAANSSETADDATAVTPVAFQRILCAVDGTRSATEAARQATTLAGPDTQLTFLAVADYAGVGPTAMAELSPDHAAQALHAARSSAQEAGIAAETRLVEAPDPRDAILAAAREHDLLVLGNPPRSRAAGIMLGATHRSRCTAAPLRSSSRGPRARSSSRSASWSPAMAAVGPSRWSSSRSRSRRSMARGRPW